LFFVHGALANGLTIAVIGLLMEISPDDRRPAYSRYFNAVTYPASMLPLLAGVIAAISGLQIIFVISLIAAIVQSIILLRIGLDQHDGLDRAPGCRAVALMTDFIKRSRC
jgi:MFS family permease